MSARKLTDQEREAAAEPLRLVAPGCDQGKRDPSLWAEDDPQTRRPRGAVARAAGFTEDGISAWLDVLMKLLRLPAEERQGVRDELEEHLRERVRDLMVTGVSEVEASRRAIAELGDAADLAQRFARAARPASRRRFMNFVMLGVTGAALLVGAVAVRSERSERVPMAVFQPEKAPEGSPLAAATMDMKAGATWDEFFAFAGKLAKMPVTVNWGKVRQLHDQNDQAIQPDSAIQADMHDVTLAEAVSILNDAMGVPDGGGVDFRVQNGKLAFATVEYFDRAEMLLATYDLSSIVAERLRDPDPEVRAETTDRVAQEVTHLIENLVYPNLWQDNGGDRASIARYGPKLFISAPKRLHPKIRWVLDELPGSHQAAAGGDDRAAWLRGRIEGGRVREDGILLDENGRPADGAEIKLDPRIKVLNSGKAHTSESLNIGRDKPLAVTQGVPLRHADAAAVLDGLKHHPGLRGLDPSQLSADPATNTIFVGGSTAEVVRVLDVIAQFDRTAMKDEDAASAAKASKTFKTERMPPAAMREVISMALNRVPGLAQCAVPRVLEVDQSDGTFTVTTTPDQIDPIARLVAALDLPGPSVDQGDMRVTISIPMMRFEAAVAQELLTAACNLRPDLVKAFDGRQVTTDPTRNALVVSARPGQVEFVKRFAETLDGS